MNVALGLLAIAQLDDYRCGCEFDAIRTMSRVGLGKMCHARSLSHWPVGKTRLRKRTGRIRRSFAVLKADFHPVLLGFLSNPVEGWGQCGHKVGGHQRKLANTLSCDVSRQAMQVNRGEHSLELTLWMLRNHSCNNARQNVA